MHFPTLATGLSLLALVSANPVSKLPTRGSAARGLNLRQDEPEYFCDEEGCGDACPTTKRLTKKFPAPALARRDIDAPEEGELDSWFADKWGSGDLIEVPFDVEDDYNEWFQLFEDDSFAMGLKGLYGCTSVIIASERGALLSHFWERPWFQDEGLFNEKVIQSLEDNLETLGFRKDDQPSLQVAIYTKFDTSGSNSIKYPDQVSMIHEALTANIPLLSDEDIQDIGYYANPSDSESNDVAAGKVIITYDPEAEDGNPGFNVWAGSLRRDDGSGMPAEEINSPILSATWESD